MSGEREVSGLGVEDDDWSTAIRLAVREQPGSSS
jgi:hypothetical protein